MLFKKKTPVQKLRERPEWYVRELYEQARKRGAIGTNTVAEVFFSDEFQEVAK